MSIVVLFKSSSTRGLVIDVPLIPGTLELQFVCTAEASVGSATKASPIKAEPLIPCAPVPFKGWAITSHAPRTLFPSLL